MLKLHLTASASWTPNGEMPDVTAIAPLLRRRMSPLARTAVAVALECCRKAKVTPEKPSVVFASRHGEMAVTVNLLGQMLAGETLSPSGFSNSVHHTTVGYFSLVAGNRQPMRAVGGRQDSFCYGFLDALGLLAESSPVLLIAADDELTPPYDALVSDTRSPHAVAFMFERASDSDSDAITLQVRSREDGKEINSSHAALDFLRWVGESEKILEHRSSRKIWRWQR